MSLGLGSKLNVLQESPLDHKPRAAVPIGTDDGRQRRWVPSHYNVRAATSDGRLIIWNSFRGTMSVFKPEQRGAIEKLIRRTGCEAKPEGIIKYLSDRGFLVEEGTDEYRKVQLAFGREHYRSDLLQLLLLSSEDCNFRCEYCYEDFHRGTMQPWVRDGIKKMVEQRAPNLRALAIEWFGGEPLYGLAAIEDLAPFFLATAEEHGLYYSSTMTTNGYLLSPDVADKLLSWQVKGFQITLDGAPEDHDRNRPGRDGSSTFATIFENLQSMRQRDDLFRIDIRVNFDQKNYPNLESFLDMIEAEFSGDSRFRMRFRAVGRWGGDNDDDLAVCGVDESVKVQQLLKEEARRRGLILSDELKDVKSMKNQVCYAARPYHLVIGAEGQIMKCTIELDKNERNVVGHIREDGSMEIDEDKFALWTEPAFQRDTQCQKCVVLPNCQGIHCPLVRMKTEKSPCTPLRLTAKQELRGLWEAVGQVGRRVNVGGEAANATIG